MRTEPRPQVTFTENRMRFGHTVFEICKRTYRQTDKQTDILIAILRPPNWERSNYRRYTSLELADA